ncbi:hypothetical protein [Parasulfitobacter algicola]|uniref:DUF4352 domain-containing protein n=1 Tax=Parasulfitobacter algicola TaxID=2614809 RepID=A0ABX2IN96_9RHOB|nr:hypothetical protein [Sulfitobacter algicola]NSX54359.1 hypothetical protein [Sulfitobacter algicola]
MIVEDYTYYALFYAVPVGIFLIFLLFAKILRAQFVRVLCLIIGSIGAVGYYMYFDLNIAAETLAVYSTNDCSVGTKSFRLPIGEQQPMKINKGHMATNDDTTKRFWVIVENNSPRTLYVDAISYTAPETVSLISPPGEEYVGYSIPPGETHGLRMPHQDTYFLSRSPDEITLNEAQLRTGAWKYEVLCQ